MLAFSVLSSGFTTKFVHQQVGHLSMQRKNTLVTCTALACSALIVLIGYSDSLWVCLLGVFLFYLASEVCLKFSFTIISEYFNEDINLLIVKVISIVMSFTTAAICVLIGGFYLTFKESHTRVESLRISFFPVAIGMNFLSFLNGCVCSILIYKKKNQGRKTLEKETALV